MFLLVLTVVTGLVDAFSYLTLGHVFVANMTGNVVFLGFAVAGIGEIAIRAIALAILAFVLGATVAGRVAASRPPHRGYLLAAAAAVQAGLVWIAVVVASVADVRVEAVQLTLAGLLGVAMGAQNAVVRRLAVPDLTTTVLTLTVAGLVADNTSRSVRLRRLASIVSMLVGAFLGGVLLRSFAVTAPLWLAGVLLTACAASVYGMARLPAAHVWR